MFFDELSPVVQQLASHPVAFFGGFVSGLFRLNLGDDPVKSWLDQQVGTAPSTGTTASSNGHQNGSSRGPQSISIE
ncbi:MULTISPECIES: hypothetical protein [unclassified Leptolyngbya]|uniref:hypothetical protein n=1 Tax=unclassified Leptolyngbya TaxID=2650499 RepID=UPI0016873803|nr:hypothetical protein [Leptolyngbya sp. FACHB-8]MBD2155343.1 hypothetical protein [Leptolyngbya sp. FACHB-16]